MTSDTPTTYVVVYTLARKFPKMIGKFPNGQDIPFGPYTRIQCGVIVAAATTVLIVFRLFHPPMLPTLLIAAAATIVAVIASGRIGFSMARTSSRLIWLIRPRLYRAPLSTGRGRAHKRDAPAETAKNRSVLDLEFWN
jgi:hypothetical protein